MCGCFLPNKEYDTQYGQFGIEKECDPICSIDSALKPGDPTSRPFIKNGSCIGIPVFKTCDQTICVIDNVNIKISNSTTGKIDFEQACGNCNKNSSGKGSKAECACFISNLDFEAIQSQIGNVELKQNCGGSLKCFKEGPAGTPPIIVECGSGKNPGDTPGGNSTGETETELKKLEQELSKNERTVLIITGIVILIIIIFVVFAIFRKQK